MLGNRSYSQSWEKKITWPCLHTPTRHLTKFNSPLMLAVKPRTVQMIYVLPRSSRCSYETFLFHGLSIRQSSWTALGWGPGWFPPRPGWVRGMRLSSDREAGVDLKHGQCKRRRNPALLPREDHGGLHPSHGHRKAAPLPPPPAHHQPPPGSESGSLCEVRGGGERGRRGSSATKGRKHKKPVVKEKMPKHEFPSGSEFGCCIHRLQGPEQNSTDAPGLRRLDPRARCQHIASSWGLSPRLAPGHLLAASSHAPHPRVSVHP